MKLAFLIPTYNRPRSLAEIVQKIHKLGDVYILDDHGTFDLTFLLKYNVKLFRNPKRNGKEGFYLTVNSLFNEIIEKEYDYFFFIPDDLIPINDFHLKAIETWNLIKDDRKVCINLFLEKSRFMKSCWTDFIPRDKGFVILSNWVDMCFMSTSKLLYHLNYQIPEPDINWKITPSMSSGVGRYISKFLVFRKGLRIYQVKSSLFISAPESSDSKMHPGRKGDHLIYKEII